MDDRAMREERAQVVIVGAGPAGLKAAISAARAGASVVVVDEHPQPGGQIFHQMPQEFALKNKKLMGSEFHRAQSLFSELSNLPIRYFFNSVVWGAFDERTLEIMDANGSFSLEGDAIILATGAYDRPVPVPGWTLPGVITVGGAQTLLKTQRLIAGQKILMAGTGPLQLVVASQLAKAGADIVAVSDPVPTRDLLQHTWSMLRAWPITRDGVDYRWNLLRKGVPWIAPSILVHIGGRDEVSSATISQVDKDWRPIAGTERTFEVDTVCIGYGLVPSIELPRLLGCEFHYEEFADAWLPDRDEYFQTTTPNLYAVGDGSCIAGAAVAAAEGTIAGFTVAHRLKHISDTFFRDAIAEPRRRLQRFAAFRLAMDTVYRPRPGLHELADDDTVICRCEEVRLLHLKEAVDDGAETVGQVKAWTRAGMGPCQGRMCSLPVTHVIANKKNKHPRSIGLQTALVPAKPVSVHSLIKDVVLTFPEDLVLETNHTNSSNDPKRIERKSHMSTSTGWIEQLMPIENQIFLDHVGFFASSLEIAADQLARLGFQVSPVNIHYSANDAGELVPTGTSNRLVVLGLGYLEVLAGSGVTPLAEELCKALTFYEGLHLIGLSHPNMAAQRERLTGAGFAMQQTIELRRRIETPAGERQLVCSVLRTIPGEMAEGRVQMLTNYTPDLVWRTESTIHKNGADALTDILICVENPAKEALRYERYTGRPAANTGTSDVIALDRGRIVLVAPDVAQKMLPGLTLPRLPFIAGVAVRTANIHITKSVLAENGVEPTIVTDDLFCIGKADAVGGYLLFHSKSIEAPWQSLYSQIAGR